MTMQFERLCALLQTLDRCTRALLYRLATDPMPAVQPIVYDAVHRLSGLGLIEPVPHPDKRQHALPRYRLTQEVLFPYAEWCWGAKCDGNHADPRCEDRECWQANPPPPDHGPSLPPDTARAWALTKEEFDAIDVPQGPIETLPYPQFQHPCVRCRHCHSSRSGEAEIQVFPLGTCRLLHAGCTCLIPLYAHPPDVVTQRTLTVLVEHVERLTHWQYADFR